MNKKIAVLVAIVLLAGCSKKSGEGNMMMNMPPPEVNVMKVAAADIAVSYEYIGQTVGSREVEVRARVTGNIEKRLYEEGAFVKAGQPLFVLDQRPFAIEVANADAAVSTAQAAVASAEASAAQAKREHDRLTPLADAKAISRKEVDDASSNDQIANANLLSAKARLQQAYAQLKQARLNISYANISAPSSGVTGRALKQEGALVTAGSDSLLTTLVQLDPLYVTFNIGDVERQQMDKDVSNGSLVLPKGGQKVRLLQRDGTPLGELGNINFASSTVSNQTGTVEMRAKLNNPKGDIKSGIFVRVVLEGAIRPHSIAVPQEAMLEGPSGKMVMMAAKDKDGKLIAEPRPIVVGDWTNIGDKKLWIVHSGLQEGDAVIVNNLMKLRPGAPITLAKETSSSEAKTSAKAN